MSNRQKTVDVDVYVALDFPTCARARSWLEQVPDVKHVKVGLELYLGQGGAEEAFWRFLHETGRRVFLDLKLHDIPNTVAGAVRALAQRWEAFPGLFSLATVHATGGVAMMRAAQKARDDFFGPQGPRLLGVTALTSLGEDDLRRWPGGEGRGAWVRVLAVQAAEADLDGVVTSVHEAPLVKAVWPQALVVTPGIRWDGDVGDQKAVGGVAQAIAAGATQLVVGRPITQAPDPAAAHRHCQELVARALGGD